LIDAILELDPPRAFEVRRGGCVQKATQENQVRAAINGIVTVLRKACHP
jgi:hypothetical protein